MKKYLIGIAAIFALAIAGQIYAAAFPPALGGLGTTQTPASGTIPIGTGAGTDTPALLTGGSNIFITNASGSVTIAVNGSSFLPSSTLFVATINGQSGAVTITSSTLGSATNTISLANGNGFTTTTIQSVLNALSATGLLTYSSSTGAFGYTSSSLALGSASHNASSDFLASSTVYVASVNGSNGAVTITSSSLKVATNTLSLFNGSGFISAAPATATINGTNGNTFTFNASSTGSALSITTSTNGIVNLLLQLSQFLTTALTSFNGATSSQQSLAGGHGVTVTTAPGTPNSTTTVAVNTSTLSTDVAGFGYLLTSSTANVYASSVQASILDTGGQVVNVKAYGATGNGTTNDTVAFQNAIAAANSVHGTVYVPNSSAFYLVNVNVLVLDGNMSFLCQSPQGTKIETPATSTQNTWILDINATSTVAVGNCFFSGIQSSPLGTSPINNTWVTCPR